MSTMSLAGRTLQSLQNAVLEYSNPGNIVEVLLGINRDLSSEELSAFGQEIARNGLDVRSLDVGTGPWENTLRLEFVRPSVKGYGLVQLIIPIAMGLAIVGLSGIIGWKLGRVIDQVSNYFIPFTLIAAGTFIAYAMVQRRK